VQGTNNLRAKRAKKDFELFYTEINKMQNFDIFKISIQGLIKNFQVRSSNLSVSNTFKGLKLFFSKFKHFL